MRRRRARRSTSRRGSPRARTRGHLAILRETFDPRHFDGAVLRDRRHRRPRGQRAGRGDRTRAQRARQRRRRRRSCPASSCRRSSIARRWSSRSRPAASRPVLARLVRERLESLLDGSFGTLAGLLERWRSRIKARLPDVDARRRFYEGVVRGRVAALLRSHDSRTGRARTRAHARGRGRRRDAAPSCWSAPVRATPAC